jgi:O-antigen ligase
MAMILALALPMAWYLGMNYRQPLLRWVCRAYLPLGLLALGLTGSRGGLVTAVVGLLIVPLSMTTLSPARLATAIAVLGLSGALAVAYVPNTMVQRLATTRESVEDLSLGGRFRIWRAGVRAFAQRPLTGYGAGAFKRAASPWMAGEERVAHNSYLSVLVEQGLVGFLLYSAMFAAVFLALLDLPPPERRFALVLLATLATAMLPLTWEDSKPVWFILAALLGLARGQVPWRGRRAPQPWTHVAGPMAPPPRVQRPRQPLTGPIRNADSGGMG